MFVKIGDTIYDANDQPIMLILTNEERQQIADMDPDSQGKYCQFPAGSDQSEIEQFMEM